MASEQSPRIVRDREDFSYGVGTQQELRGLELIVGKQKTEQGHGGKRGHSNQDNWETHQEAKSNSRRKRRLNDKQMERDAEKNNAVEDELIIVRPSSN